MQKELVIRSYLKFDREACLDMFDQNCPKYFDPSERSGFCKWLDGQDAGRIAYKNSMADFYYVALKNLSVAGCGGFYINAEKPTAHISWTLIHPSFHNNGIGKYLISFCIKQIEKLFPEYLIELETSQHTYLFFEKFGFKTNHITENGYGPGLHRYDMLRAVTSN